MEILSNINEKYHVGGDFGTNKKISGINYETLSHAIRILLRNFPFPCNEMGYLNNKKSQRGKNPFSANVHIQ